MGSWMREAHAGMYLTRGNKRPTADMLPPMRTHTAGGEGSYRGWSWPLLVWIVAAVAAASGCAWWPKPVLADKASKEWACPKGRLAILSEKTIRPAQPTPPPDVAADPDRLSIWLGAHKTPEPRYSFRVQGCGRDGVFSCSKRTGYIFGGWRCSQESGDPGFDLPPPAPPPPPPPAKSGPGGHAIVTAVLAGSLGSEHIVIGQRAEQRIVHVAARTTAASSRRERPARSGKPIEPFVSLMPPNRLCGRTVASIPQPFRPP
jgi:hypothetical protein